MSNPNDAITTDYKVRSIYIAKETVRTETRKESVFPQEYSGTSGNSLMSKAPKPVS
jgi:hypothetical protein